MDFYKRNGENDENDENADSNNCTVHLSEELKPINPIKPSISNDLVKNLKIQIEFNDLIYQPTSKYKEDDRKEILSRVNGYFQCCNINAVIGPSGAGKSTLLSLFSGLINLSKVQGDIYINRIPCTNSNILKKLTCYIPQEFEFLPWLTTKETLFFSAKLKLEKTQIKSYYNCVVNDVAKKLGLLECLNTMVEKLSGGEKKRLSIGVEIMKNPKVLVLDEPTSGLDSCSSIQIITLLKSFAQNGCTVICSIHQPSSQIVNLIDNFFVLAEGRDLYCGPLNCIVETFAKAHFACPSFYNICEFIIEVATKQRVGDLDLLREINKRQCEFLRNESYNKQTEREHNNDDDDDDDDDGKKDEEKKINGKYFKVERLISRGDEFKILLWRAFKCVQRDNTMTKLRLSTHFIVGLLLGIVFYNFGNDASKTISNISCLFFFLLFLFFANSMPAVQMFPIEAKVFAREHMNNWYSLSNYYLAKVITDLPLQVLCPTLFLLLGYSLTGQPLEFNRIFKVWLICYLLSVIAQSFGMLTGCAFNTQAGCFLIPALNIPFFLFAGFFVKLNEIPSYLYPLSCISYFRYAFEGLADGIYGGERELIQCNSICLFRSPKKILNFLNMPTTSFNNIILILIGWILALHLLIYIVLKYRLIHK